MAYAEFGRPCAAAAYYSVDERCVNGKPSKLLIVGKVLRHVTGYSVPLLLVACRQVPGFVPNRLSIIAIEQLGILDNVRSRVGAI